MGFAICVFEGARDLVRENSGSAGDSVVWISRIGPDSVRGGSGWVCVSVREGRGEDG